MPSSVPGQGRCPAPFLEEALFPPTGGYVKGRFCSDQLGFSCCLPCPQTEWLYPSNFDSLTGNVGWGSVVGMVCCVFLLASWAFLPVNKTHRHYLSICLSIAIVLMQLGFIVPLAAKPDQCFNGITPNDMHTSATCGVSGSFIVLGGWGAIMWIFLRAVALHLQICWEVEIGKMFMWCALVAGWGIPALGLIIALVFSGVSFRFGDTCHINHENSLADFWIPLLVFSGITVIIQFATFGYCIKVYLASLSDDATTTNSSGLPSYAPSSRATVSPRQAYRRVRRVIQLQWRGIAIVLLILADVVFFSVIFVFMDNNQQKALSNAAISAPWILCIASTGGDRNACAHLASSIVVNEPTIMAVLILLACNGIFMLLLFGRFTMFTGWYDLVKGTVKPNKEFVSVDVHNFKDPGSYEMLSKDRDVGKTPEPMMNPVEPAYKSGRTTPDYFGREARYKSPSRSFSSPKPPQGLSVAWDPATTHARPYVDPLAMNKI
ncbi:G protein-like protein-coupled receptor : GPCR, secretin-like protein [Xylogone sp. PMI_703]|nr:G protein-like protein-coupled receptor : GPCR, secretin-like protein [Xylogone sp. PMI_703]